MIRKQAPWKGLLDASISTQVLSCNQWSARRREGVEGYLAVYLEMRWVPGSGCLDVVANGIYLYQC